MKNQIILEHKTSLQKFEYVKHFCPQFSKVGYVSLLNLKTGKNESFIADTYMKYFKLVK